MKKLPFKAKICGLTSSDDAREIARWSAEGGAVAIGLNFHVASSRCLSSGQAKQIVAAAREVPGQRVVVVGVFVQQTFGEIESLAETVGLDWIQLHGPYRPDDLLPLTKPTIVAVPFEEVDAVERQIEAWSRWGAGAALLDAAHGGNFGGTGRPIDWSRAASVRSEIPLILAGGLKPENLASAIELVAPAAVDVASGVEVSPGKKDREKVAEFLRIAREMLAE